MAETALAGGVRSRRNLDVLPVFDPDTGSRMFSQIYDSASATWVRLTPDGGTELTPDRSRATVIESSQLDSHIRNYELDYLRNSLVLHECREDGQPI